jgi:hypothetical protein
MGWMPANDADRSTWDVNGVPVAGLTIHKQITCAVHCQPMGNVISTAILVLTEATEPSAQLIPEQEQAARGIG